MTTHHPATEHASSGTAGAGSSTIQQVRKELGGTFRTLRFYEERGLVVPRRDRTQRLYSTADIERLRAIVRLKQLGLSLREIREVLQSPSDGPYGLSQHLCQEAFNRLSVQRAEAEAGLALLADAGCRCSTTASR